MSLQQPSGEGATMIIPILQIIKLRLREIKVTKVQTTCEWHNQDSFQWDVSGFHFTSILCHLLLCQLAICTVEVKA